MSVVERFVNTPTHRIKVLIVPPVPPDNLIFKGGI